MSNGNVTSQPATPVTHGPANVTEGQAQQQAIHEAKEKAEKLVKELANVVLHQQAPPGTPNLP